MRNRRALVTGSTTGMGFAIAQGLLEAGATVILHGRTVDHVNASRAQLSSRYPNASIEGVAAELADPLAVHGLIEEVRDVDILISNAGPTDEATTKVSVRNLWVKKLS